MHCIRCKSEMKKKGLRGVLIDYCDVCDAYWLDKGELESLETGYAKSKDELSKEFRHEIQMERSRAVTIMTACPKCQSGQMMERKIDGVKVDYCKSCKGLYFDHGELDEILKNREQGFFAKFMANVFG